MKKRKFRNAEEAKKHRELNSQWEKNKLLWDKMSPKVTVNSAHWVYKLSTPPGRDYTSHIPSLSTADGSMARDMPKIPSLNSWVTGAVNTKQTQHYTGSNVLGISQMAKSNAVPVFNSEHIIEIARMRR